MPKSFYLTITKITLITGNQQIDMSGNPNVSYVVADNGNAYPVYPYMPGNFGEHNQMDRMYYIKNTVMIIFTHVILIIYLHR